MTRIPSTGVPPHVAIYSALVCIGNKVYSFGGGSEDSPIPTNEFKEFNMVTNTWSSPVTGSESVPSPRSGLVMGSYLGNPYIFGGLTIDGVREDLWCYNTTTALWVLLPISSNAPVARTASAFTQSGEIIYMFGGVTYSGMDSAVFM